MHAQSFRRAAGLAVLLFVGAGAARAEIEAPDHVLYGSATLFGQQAPVGSLVEARSVPEGTLLARYTLGRDPRLGSQYRLSIPMSALNARVAGSARPGDPIRVFLGPRLAAETSVGAEGVARRLDIDPQGQGSGPAIDGADISGFEGSAGSVPFTFELSLNTTSTSAVGINYETRSGSAIGGASCTSGVDFIQRSGSLSIPAGSLSQSLSVQVCGDNAIEGAESFTLELLSASNGVLVRPALTATIIDDDDVPQLQVDPLRVLEPVTGSAVARLRARLSRASTFETRFNFATQNVSAVAGSDYTAASGTAVIPAGDTEAVIEIAVLADAVVEPDETFRVVLSQPFNLSFATPQVLVTVVDPAYAPEVALEQDVIGGAGGLAPLVQPSALALSPDGEFAYVSSETRDAVLVFARDPDNGRLSYLREYRAVAGSLPEARLDGAKHLIVSPDGRHVYVAARNDSAIAVLSRSAGELDFVANQVQGQADPSATGAPATAGLTGVVRLAMSPDGQHVYAAGSTGNSLAVFARDADTGRLRFLEAEINGQDDSSDAGPAVSALERPAGLVVSPDGAQVYVAARFSNAVLVFDRVTDPNAADSGRLSFRSALRNGLLGVSSIAGASDLVLSADGGQLYVAAEADNAVVLFERAATGALTWRQAWKRGEPGLPGLSGPQALSLSPDGSELYVPGFGDSSLTIFGRNQGATDAGVLRPLQTLFDEEGELFHMGGPVAAVPSADDRHLYVVANTDSSVVVLRRLASDRIFNNGFED
jgi:DNA-binding beta-propeller fold protein YncE